MPGARIRSLVDRDSLAVLDASDASMNLEAGNEFFGSVGSNSPQNSNPSAANASPECNGSGIDNDHSRAADEENQSEQQPEFVLENNDRYQQHQHQGVNKDGEGGHNVDSIADSSRLLADWRSKRSLIDETRTDPVESSNTSKVSDDFDGQELLRPLKRSRQGQLVYLYVYLLK